MTVNEINELIKQEGIDTNLVSDGYHTFGELYEHRVALFIALCNVMMDHSIIEFGVPWKSKKHSDGSEWQGWFIAGINAESGKQMSYHLPTSKWELLKSLEVDKAPEWDGHTPQDVLERLKSI